MVSVIVDTNIIGGTAQQPLDSREMRLLLDETQRGNLRLVVPEVVLREAANLWAERVVKQASNYVRARTVLKQAGLVQEETTVRVTKAEARIAEEGRIRGLLAAADALIAPLPEVSQEVVVERALQRCQPFDSNGRNGYRDVVVWETVLGVGRGQDWGSVVFIANDESAFFEGRKFDGGLANELAAEFETASAGAVSLTLFRDAKEAYLAALELAEKESKERIAAQEIIGEAWVRNLNKMMMKDPGFAMLISDAVDEALRNWNLGQDLREFGVPDSDVYDAYVDVVESLHKIEFTKAHVASDGDVLAELRAEAVCWAEATLSSSIAMVLDEHPQVQIRSANFESGVAEGQIEIAARVTVDVVVDPKGARPTSIATVSGFTPLAPPEFFLGMKTPPGIAKVIDPPPSTA